jgi:hypothetical protein
MLDPAGLFLLSLVAGFMGHPSALIEKIFGGSFESITAIIFFLVGPKFGIKNVRCLFPHHFESSAIHGDHFNAALPTFAPSVCDGVGFSHQHMILPLLFLHPPLNVPLSVPLF